MFAELLIEEEESPKIPLLQSCIEELQAKVSKQTGIANTLNTIDREQGGGQPVQQNEPSQIGAIQGY